MTAASPEWRKLGLIAAGGRLPVAIAETLSALGREFFVARIEGMAEPALERFPGASFGLGEMGARFRTLRAAGCDAVTMVGLLRRPDFSKLQLDAAGLALLPSVIAAARKGDDAILRVLVRAFESEGFRVIGAEEASAQLLATAGPMGAHAPDQGDLEDIAKGAAVAAAIGAWDVGQGAVVCDGLVLALEGQEGTDLMLRRVGELPEEIRGSAQARRGVLVKRPKPIQERRIDLPTMGLRTLEGAAAAGLKGVAVEALGALVIDRAAVIARADELGLFVFGFSPE